MDRSHCRIAHPNSRRSARFINEAISLARKGYEVYSLPSYPNNAYYAIEKGSKHEKLVCEIAAENGFPSTLSKEGTLKVKLPDGTTLTAVSLDGTFKNFTQEIMALNGKPNPGKVADAISHSYKHNKFSRKQANLAISITPENSTYTTKDILNGVKEYRRRLREGETVAKPKYHIHIDAKGRKLYLNRLT